MNSNYFKAIYLVFFFSFFLSTHGQSELERIKITDKYNKQVLSQLENQFGAQDALEKQEALEAARINNWPIIIDEDGRYAELQKLAPDGSPIYYVTSNVDAAESTRTNHLNTGGSLGLNLDGQSMIAYVWDGGHARVTHQEYDGAGGTDRVSVEDAASEGGVQLNFHAAHVSGTIAASGVDANAKGMAWQSQVRGYMWNNDVSEATAAASNGMLLSNHSYGFRSNLVPDYYFGGYITTSRNWDNLMYNAPYYLMVVAAGNDGNTNYNGSPLDGNSAYDKLTGHATSKNNMVVANAQDANVNSSGDLLSVTINSSSSEGPTDDYRIKPDITGNGTGLYSTYEDFDTHYASITGTSMASPNVTGSLLLLQQHANNLNGSFMRAATLKGLALHTADDIGPTGPDAVHGWGLLNAKRAAETITTNGNASQISELTLSSGQTYQITVNSDGMNDLIASISWTDPPGTASTALNSNTPVLVNDLDLRVSQGGTTYNPWRLTSVNTNGLGDNIVDPYELVNVSGASGTYTITVTHKGTLTGSSQNYTLIITGLSTTSTCVATVPTNLSIDTVADTTAELSWDAVTNASSYVLRYREVGTSTWISNAVTATTINLSGLSQGTTYEAQVRSVCPDNSTSSYSSSLNFTTTSSNSYDVCWTDLENTSVSSNTITKTGANGWNGGGASTGSIPSGDDGWAEIAPSTTSGYYMFGLSEVNSNSNWNTIEHAMYIANNGINVYESGSYVGNFGTFSTGDTLRVERQGTDVVYKKNGSIFHTSSGVDSSKSLLVDISIYSTGVSLTAIASFDCQDQGSSYDVCWTDLENTSVSGNTITKTGTTGWNGGGASTGSIPSGDDGWAEIAPSTTSGYYMFGLSEINSNSNWNTIEHAMYIANNGINVYESGSYVGNFGTFSAGDTLRVERQGTDVVYKKNGSIFHTSSGVDSSKSLLVDISIYSTGVSLTAIASFDCQDQGSSYDVCWTDLENTSVSGNTITKTGTTGWNGGGASTGSIPSGDDGWAEIAPSTTSGYYMFGLSEVNSNSNWNTIEHAMYIANNGINVYESGSYVGNFGTFSTGDTLRVERQGTDVVYKKNGSIFHTSSGVDSSKSLLVDISIYSTGVSLTAIASFDCQDQGSSYDVCWTDLENTSVSGNTITKTGTTGWNGGGASTGSIPSGDDGWAEIAPSTTSGYYMFGLSEINSNSNWNTIEHAMYIANNGINVYESGSYVGNFGTFSAGDTLRVERQGTDVVYKKNGSIFHTSSGVDSSKSLLVDISIYSTGVSLTAIASFDCQDQGSSYDVCWTDLENTSVSGNTITKTGTTGWNGGGASTGSIPSGDDGWAEITPSTTSGYYMFGLSEINSNSNWNTIEHAMYIANNGINVYESGSYVGNFGTFSTGDTLRVERQGTDVVYKKNGSIFHTSNGVDSSKSLLVDISIYSTGVSLTAIASFDCQDQDSSYDVCWADLENTSASGNTITKTGTNGWNGGGASTGSIPSGDDGWVEVEANSTSGYRMFGLSETNSNSNWNTIEHAMYLANGNTYIYESGSYVGNFGTFSAGDTLRVERQGTDVVYKKNGSIFHTSSGVDSSKSLLVDISIYSTGVSLTAIASFDCGNGGSNTSEPEYVVDIIEDISEELPLEINVYPNPSNGLFNVNFGQQLKDTNIKVFSITGALVYDKTFNLDEFTTHVKIDISSQQEGMYFMKINSEDNVITKRLIIKK